jgi:uncharacterized Zn finger protein
MTELKCPACGGGKLMKAGMLWSGHKYLQNYRCKECGTNTVYPVELETEATEQVTA